MADAGGDRDRGSEFGPVSSARGPLKSSLQDIAAGFSTFEWQLEQETNALKVQEQGHIQNIQGYCWKLEEFMHTEAERAAELERELQSDFADRLAEAQETLEKQFTAEFDSVRSVFAGLDERLGLIEATYAQACDRYIQEMREETVLNQSDCMRLNRCFRTEKSERSEGENGIQVNAAELEASSSRRAGDQQQRSDDAWGKISEDVKSMTKVQDRAVKDHQDVLIGKVEQCRAVLAAAARTREQADDDIVTALNHYTQVLQDAVTSATRGGLLEAVL